MKAKQEPVAPIREVVQVDPIKVLEQAEQELVDLEQAVQ